ncbi:MAG: adenine deaminase C-terminal domain-containing protein [Desulfobacterales bacterium]|jgi:adenine deaminase
MIASGILKPKTPQETSQLMKVALGEEKADLIVVNANVVNVYTGEILPNLGIAIQGKWIAYVGENAEDSIGPQTKVIDADGQTIIPGLIDGHTHIAWMFTVAEFLKYTIAGGTTTIVTETLEPFFVCGYEGVNDFQESLKDQPIKILATAPALVSISRTARDMPPEILAKLLNRDDILGLGESYWQGVLQAPEQVLPRFEQTLAAGKTLEGHSAGARDRKLAAYVAGGISSCHEPINADQVLERLRMGLHILVREGSIRRDLAEIAKIKDTGIDLRRLILSTDGVEPRDLIEKGYMEYVLRKAIDHGFDPVVAIQMATLNVAEHFSLDGLIGGIAPGRYADLVMIPDVQTIEAQMVISNGSIVADKGRLLTTPRPHTFSKPSMNSIKLPRDMKSSDFIISTDSKASHVNARIIDMVTDLVTAELEMQWPVINGRINRDVDQDVIKVAAIDRTHNPGNIFVGLIKGFGLKSGAMACSSAWDTSDIIVAGANDADMAGAVNRIRALQGGAVVYENGEILAELPLPIFGIMSDLPIETISQRLQKIKSAVSDLGVPFPDPLLTLITLTGAAIPYLRICEEGLVNLKDGKTVGLVVS